MNNGVGACRGKDSGDWGRWGTDYVLVRDKDEAACQAECDSRSDCKAIEIKKGLMYCKLWLTEPLATSTSTSSQCLKKVRIVIGMHVLMIVKKPVRSIGDDIYIHPNIPRCSEPFFFV